MQEPADKTISIRDAIEADFPTISSLIVENAEYLGVKSPVYKSTEELVEDCLKSTPPKFYCIVASVNNQLVGYTIYNQAYSTWVGRMINVQDFYLRTEHRQQPVEEQLLKSLVSRAQKMGCRRVAWLAPNNATEYKKFWAKNGAVDITVDENWHQYRLEADKFQAFIDRCA